MFRKAAALFYIILIICFTSLAQGPGLSSLRKSCSILQGGTGIVVDGDWLLGRYPSPKSLSVSISCKDAAQKAVQKWIEEDIANWEQLSNQACSAALGWVQIEYCPAGGPPPICRENHWLRRSIIEAKRDWDSKNARVRDEREQQMIANACGCWLSELKSISISQSASTSPTITFYGGSGAYGEPFILPCPDGKCPPGMECVNGRCRPPTESERRKKEAIDFLADKAKEKAKDEIIKIFSETLAKALESKTATIVTGILESRSFSKWQDGYERSARELSSRVIELKARYEEMDSYVKGRPSRAPQFIEKEIEELKMKLREDMQFLNEYYAGIIRERELGKYCCQEIFEYQHQKVNQAMVNLLSLPIPNKDK